jgi:hypothetical protein
LLDLYLPHLTEPYVQLASNKMQKFLKRLLLLAIFSFATSCQKSVTYYDDSPKPPTPLRYYQPNYPTRYNNPRYPHSGVYRNPYKMPPRNYYPYYDLDNYYVPPAGYNPYDKQETEFNSGKFNLNNIM